MGFHFLRPEWLAVLPFVLFAGWWLGRPARFSSGWAQVCRSELLPLLLEAPQKGTVARLLRPAWLAALAGVIGCVALAGPTWEELPTPVFRDDAALIIAFDLSNSMRAEDLKPSRFERARFKVSDLLAARKAGQTALIAYSGSAFTVTPLTQDTDTIEALLFALDPGIMPVQGTNTADVVNQSIELMRQTGVTTADLLLVTDGVREGELDTLIARAQTTGLRISVLGMGTQGGAPIPSPSGQGFMRDRNGVVMAKLAPAPLKRLAASTGGLMVEATPDQRDVTQLSAMFESRLGAQSEASETGGIPRWRDMGPFGAVLLLAPLAFLFRRRWLFCVPFLLPTGLGAAILVTCLGTLVPSAPAAARDLSDWFKNDAQRALEDFRAQRFGEAQKGFRDPRWQAATAYRAGDYERALELLESQTDIDSIYNRGNALAELERYEEAIEAYAEVLARDPEHEDARYNKEYLENLPEQPPQDGGGEGSDDDSESEQGESSESDSEQTSDSPQQNDSQQQGGGEPQPEQQEAQDGEQSGRQPSEPEEQAPEETEQAEQPQPDAADEQPQPEQETTEEEIEATADQAGELNEQDQAREQWLRRIPDDPAGLLRRKFRYQYQTRNEPEPYQGEPW